MNSTKLIPGQLYLLCDIDSFYKGSIVQYTDSQSSLKVIYKAGFNLVRTSFDGFHIPPIGTAALYDKLISLGTTELIEKINKL